MEVSLLINVKMPTIVGILTFMSGKICNNAYLRLKNAEFLDIFILMSIYNFMLNLVEHEIVNAHKYKNYYCWHFNIYERENLQ